MLLTRNIPRGSFYLKIANNNLFLTILLEIIITICKRQLLGSENIYLGPLVLEGSNGGGGSHILGGSETRTLKFPCSLFKGFLEGRYFNNQSTIILVLFYSFQLILHNYPQKNSYCIIENVNKNREQENQYSYCRYLETCSPGGKPAGIEIQETVVNNLNNILIVVI